MSSYIGQVPGHGQIQYFTFIATAGQTVFSGIDSNKYVLNYSAGFCDVFLNGRRLTPTSDYTATDGSTITLQSATSLNDVIFVASASTFDTADWVTNAVNYVYTATAGQTTFTGADDNSQTLSYVNGTILVSVNGINIPQSDYTATNGTSVVLNSGVNLGDIVQIFSLRTMAVVNFLPITGGTVTGTITVGNSSVNTQITAGNIALNGSTLLIGNSTSNVVLTGTTLTISNSSSNVSISPGPVGINAIATNTFTIGSTLYAVANGNIGIGTATPDYRLTVPGIVASNTSFRIFGGANPFYSLADNTGTGTGYLQIASSILDLYYTNSISISAGGGGNRVLFASGGNVGIGNNSPVTKLHITSDNQGGDLIRLTSSNSLGTAMNFISTANNGRSYRIGSNFVDGYGEFSIYDATATSTRFRISNTGVINIYGNTNIRSSEPSTGGLTVINGTYDPRNVTYDVGLFQNQDAACVRIVEANSSSSINELSLCAGDGPGSFNSIIGATGSLTFATNRSYGAAGYSTSGEVMRITSGARVGIGTTTPAQKLHVYNGCIYGDNPGYVSYIMNAAGSAYGYIQNDTGGVWSLAYGTSAPTVGTPVISWTSNRRAGINTTSPSSPLEVRHSTGSTGNTDYFFTGGSGTYNMLAMSEDTSDNMINMMCTYASYSKMSFWTSPTTGGGPVRRMVIDYNGQVTKPYQHAWHYTGGTTFADSTYNITKPSNAVISNANYNSSTGLFTAPITGKYLIGVWGLLYPHSSTVLTVYAWKNGGAIGQGVQGGWSGGSHTPYNATLIVHLTAGDTIGFAFYRGSSSDGVNAYSSQWNQWGYFLG